MANADVDSNWLRNMWGPPIPQKEHNSHGRKIKFALPHLSRNRMSAIILLLAMALFAFPAIFFYTKYQNEKTNAKELTKSLSENEAKTLMEKVGGFVELPKDETPTIATVSDAEKLSSQAFFSHAQDGDKVIIYDAARRAILYRPSTNKVIEVASLAIPDTSDKPQAAGITTTATSSPTIIEPQSE